MEFNSGFKGLIVAILFYATSYLRLAIIEHKNDVIYRLTCVDTLYILL